MQIASSRFPSVISFIACEIFTSRKVKGNDGETARNAPNGGWHTVWCSSCAVQDHCYKFRLFHAQMSISVVKTHPGGCLFWQNSFWWVSLPLAYPASRLQSTDAKTKPLSHFTPVFFWLMNPNISIILHHSKVSHLQSSALQPYCSFLLTWAQVSDTQGAELSVWGCHRS